MDHIGTCGPSPSYALSPKDVSGRHRVKGGSANLGKAPGGSVGEPGRDASADRPSLISGEMIGFRSSRGGVATIQSSGQWRSSNSGDWGLLVMGYVVPKDQRVGSLLKCDSMYVTGKLPDLLAENLT